MVVNTIRSVCNRQVAIGVRKEQCKVFQVPRGCLKQYATLKTEALIKRWRRPEVEFTVEDHTFEESNPNEHAETFTDLDQDKNIEKVVAKMKGDEVDWEQLKPDEQPIVDTEKMMKELN